MPSYRDDGQLGEEVTALLPHYKDKTDVLRAAVALLHWLYEDRQITALVRDLDMERQTILKLAVAQLHQRELGESDRDVLAELDEIKERLTKAGL